MGDRLREEGVPRWWHSPETRALWGQVLGDGSISWARSFGDGVRARPAHGPRGSLDRGQAAALIKTRDSIIDGHELRELDGGNFLIGSYVPCDHIDLDETG